MINGTLRQTGSERWVFLGFDGGVHDDLRNPNHAPKNIQISVRIVGDTIVQWDYTDAPVYSLDDTRKDIALLRVSETSVPPGAAETLKETAAELEHRVRLQCHDQWDVTVTPYIILNDGKQSLGLYTYSFTHSDVQRQMQEQNPDGFDQHNYFGGMGGSSPGLNGIAFLGSGRFWIYTPDNVRVITHEFFHSVGGGHSTSPASEYGDTTAILAKAYTGLNVLKAILFDLIPPEMVEAVGGSVTRAIVPVETHPQDVRAGELYAAKVTGDRLYYISTRKTSNQSVLGTREHALYVHSWERGVGSPKSVYHGSCSEGNTLDIEPGLSVQYAGRKDGATKARIIVDSKTPEDIPWPQAQPPMPGDPITRDHAAVWESAAGEGLDVLISGKKLVAYWFTYHPRGPHSAGFNRRKNGRRWFRIDGDIRGGFADCTIYSFAGGEQKTEGTGTIRFDADTGLLRCYTEAYGRIHLHLTRVTTPKDSQAVWESGQHQGFSISTWGDQTLAYWFGRQGHEPDWSLIDDDLTEYRYTKRFMERRDPTRENVGKRKIDTSNMKPVIT